MLSCRELTKSYGSANALCGVSLDIYKGRIVGLLGPNGSGKTTMIKMAAGLLTPGSGTITINGEPIGVKTKKIVSYLPDRDYLPDYMKVSEIVKLFSEFYEDFDIANAFDMLNRLGIDLNKKFKAMSKGMREKIQLSLVMSRRALIYLLDEPIAGVDPAARDYILNTILSNYNRESTLIISTHLIRDIEPVLDDVLMLQYGTVRAYDSAENMRAKTGMSVDEYFREVYRC